MDALESLQNLQRALGRLKEAEAELETMPPDLAALHADHVARGQQRQEVEAELSLAAAERRQFEAETADVQTKLTRFQEQIPSLRTQREYAAMLQEIDAAKARIKELEELTLAALERHDTATAQLSVLDDAVASGEAAYQEGMGQWEARKPALREEADKLRGTVATLREQITRPHLSLFDRVLQRTGGEALAVIQRHAGPASNFYHCGACHYQIRFQAVAEIRRGELRQCESCKRILFAESEV